MHYRFHLISLAHLPQSRTYMSCAFTQKNRKLAKMLTGLGHEVFFYGSEGSDVVEYCKSDRLHFVQTHTLSDMRKDYGDGDNRYEIGYDWTNQDYRHDFSSERKPGTKKFYRACIDHINKIKKPDDFLLCTQGVYHKPIADEVNLFLTCESGIGYRGSVHGWFRSFESSYIQNYTYGYEGNLACINGSYYDRVIPNYFDPDDISYSEKKNDYYLFIGRMIKRKGIVTASLVTRALGKKLVVVGQGGVVKDGKLTATVDPDFEIPADNVEYLGFLGAEKRKWIMAHAKATFTPTEYLECFAGTHVESMLSGTPVITTNFGVYPGTVINGVNGYRCDTLDDFVEAAKKAPNLEAKTIRKSAEKYLMDNVRWDFQKWFDDLYAVYESAMKPGVKGWSRIRESQPEWREHITW